MLTVVVRVEFEAPDAAPAADEGVTATLARGDYVMTLPTSDEHHEAHPHHHKQGQVAKRLESLVSVAMAVVGVALLVGVGYAILGGGPQVPPWMR